MTAVLNPQATAMFDCPNAAGLGKGGGWGGACLSLIHLSRGLALPSIQSLTACIELPLPKEVGLSSGPGAKVGKGNRFLLVIQACGMTD